MIRLNQAAISEFWARESELARTRASDPATCRLALREFDRMISEGKFREASFEVSLRNGEENKNIVLQELSRKGGSTPRQDALNDLIQSKLIERPKLLRPRYLRGSAVRTELEL
jgi:hypothetical protein